VNNTTYGKLNNKKSINIVFLDAALVYECGGEWRNIVRKAYNTTNGHRKKMFNVMSRCTTPQMETFCRDLAHNYRIENE
jgi:hypothetical protein